MATSTTAVVQGRVAAIQLRQRDGAQDLSCLTIGIPSTLPPPARPISEETEVPHAPRRPIKLTREEVKLAIRNALRYFPAEWHAELAQEFAQELEEFGHIYMRRFRPSNYEMRAHPIDAYPARSRQAAAIMLMIMFPHELITYGGNGSVFQNWAQYLLVMKYLSEMEDDQTLVMYSGHPLGLFPSTPHGPRVVVTNGMVIPNYSTREMYERMYALGNSQYGQMTAGSYCYIGPQGIVHGTTITVLNAGRKYLGLEDMSGVVYVSSGLGGMSGAQPKAGVIAGMISVTAEVDEAAVKKRHQQGWVNEVVKGVDNCIARIRRARQEKKSVSIAYHGNVVELWEKLAECSDEEEMLVELGSDQTSLHNPYTGGYYPVQLSFEDARRMMIEDPETFKDLVQESLRRQVAAINKLTAKGMKFWDYGNSFLLEASRANADIRKKAEELTENDAVSGDIVFKYPSYVQDIMGDIFSLGFGPFRWVCCSGDQKDLLVTDQLAEEVLCSLLDAAEPRVAAQLRDNIRWIQKADENKLVVGSQARILYAHAEGRAKIALAINKAIGDGRLSGPVVLSRDHHDVSGTDSPFRETSNVYDGSAFCADMAVQNCIGDSFRGATWVALHNGGGVGWGEVMNGGFGLVLDGSEETGRRAELMLSWDVNNGVCRRAWARNENAEMAIRREMEMNPKLKVTLPQHADDKILDSVVSGAIGR